MVMAERFFSVSRSLFSPGFHAAGCTGSGIFPTFPSTLEIPERFGRLGTRAAPIFSSRVKAPSVETDD